LTLVTVDGARWPAILAQHVGEVVGHALRLGEDQDLLFAVHDLLQDLVQMAFLIRVRANCDNLLDL